MCYLVLDALLRLHYIEELYKRADFYLWVYTNIVSVTAGLEPVDLDKEFAGPAVDVETMFVNFACLRIVKHTSVYNCLLKYIGVRSFGSLSKLRDCCILQH